MREYRFYFRWWKKYASCCLDWLRFFCLNGTSHFTKTPSLTKHCKSLRIFYSYAQTSFSCHVVTLSLNLIMEVMLTATISTLLILLLGYWIRRRRLAGAGLPPGPLCLPIVGTMLSGDLGDLPKTMAKWARQYGSVFTSYIGPYRVVVLSSPAVVKEAFSKDVFVPRPMLWSAMERSKMNNNATGLRTANFHPGFEDNLETKSIG